jgi:hypothetical protein
LIAAFGTAKEAVAANAKVAIGIGAAAGVAGIATIAVLAANSGNEKPPVAVPSIGISTPAGPTTPVPTTPVPSTPVPTHSPTPQQHTGGGGVPVVFHPTPPPPTKTPSSPPSTPTPPPFTTPPVTSADVSVNLDFQAKLGLLGAQNAGTIGNLTATTDGVPTGMKGTITIQTLGATLEQIGTGCTVAGDTTTCPIWQGMAPLVFKMIGVPVATSATVSGPAHVTDPAPRNNHASVLLGLLG